MHTRITAYLYSSHNITVPISARDPEYVGGELMKNTYWVIYCFCLVKTLTLEGKHKWSKFGICVSLLMRMAPALIMSVGIPYEQKSLDVISDGFFTCILITDIMLAKMAGREIHPWVVLMSAASRLSHSFILTLCFVYYIAVFGDLCHYMNMPLLSVCRNVYCAGVYDLCHIGHKNLFKKALTYGNRLYVGVCNDVDCSSYKRPPIMTHDERCREVQGCKSVTKVIPNAPCFGLTREFIEKHQIHVVAFGEEYVSKYPNPSDDPYYGYARSIGIARAMPRTPGLSTTDLIKRIQNAREAEDTNNKGGREATPTGENDKSRNKKDKKR